MQIRLTVVDPQAPASETRGQAASCDVLVTAPAGTALSAVAAALSSAVTGEAPGSGAVVLYAGEQRLDTTRTTLGEPPLIDGAVLSLGVPAAPEAHPEIDDAPARLHVVAGPDAGGVHLLHGGQIRVGRSTDADVPLDDPDVSRVHCAVTLAPDGRVTVTDLGSTNGTTLDGVRVTDRPALFPPGALLRLGESALRLAPTGDATARVTTTPDGEGHVRVAPVRVGGENGATGHAHGTLAPEWGSRAGGPTGSGEGWQTGTGDGRPTGSGDGSGAGARGSRTDGRPAGSGDGSGAGAWGSHAGGRSAEAGDGSDAGARGSRAGGGLSVPGQGGAPRIENRAGGEARAGAESHAGAEDPAGADGRSGTRHAEADGHAASETRTGAERRAGGAGPGWSGRHAESGAQGSPTAPQGGAANRAGLDGYAGPSGAQGYAGTQGSGHQGYAGAQGHAGGDDRAEADSRAGADGRASGDGRARFDGTLPRGARPLGGRLSGAGSLSGPGSPSGAGPAAGAGSSFGPGSPAGAGAPSGGSAVASPSSPNSSGDTHGGRSGIGSPVTAPADGVDRPAQNASRMRAGDGVHGDVPQGGRKRGGLSAWARRLTGNRNAQEASGPQGYDAGERVSAGAPPVVASPGPEIWPDPAALLLTALGPGPRLWERAPGHPEFLTVRLATADRPTADGAVLPVVPVTAALREAGALGLAGPRPRLSGLARAVLAQFAALHSPDTLEIVLLTTDRARPPAERTAEWSWLGWLPHVRPAHSQECRLLLAHDHDQATARVAELLHRLDGREAPRAGGATEHPATPGDRPRASAPAHAASATSDAHAAGVPLPAQSRRPHPDEPHRHAPTDAPEGTGHPYGAEEPARRPSWAKPGSAPVFPGPYTVVVVDGDPGTPALREALVRLVRRGPEAGIHVLVLSETDPGSLALPVAGAYEAACAVVPLFRECGAVGLLGGDVATVLRLARVAPGGGPVGEGTAGAVDAVSAAWAERFARALAPLRPDATAGDRHARVAVPLPQSARLLDELGLARATPASLMARWADAADDADAVGGRALAVLGAGARGPVAADLVADGPHLLIEGPAGSGRTELLRAVVASLAAAERPDRLSVVLMDGRDSIGRSGEGLRVCTDLPHVTTHLTANDPVVMREFAQSLTSELKRRAELVGRTDFTDWHTHRSLSGRLVNQRTTTLQGASARQSQATSAQGASARQPQPATAQGAPGHAVPAQGAPQGATDLEAPPSTTLRLRPGAAKSRRDADVAPPLPRLIVVVDDLDALVSPALGSPGRPSAGSVTRALEAVAREGARLGVHLVAATGPGGRTAESEPARRATLRIALEAPGTAPDEPAAGRGRLATPDGRTALFQGGRVTGRIPRTATLRPTVTPLEWHRMGDPPARRTVRELGNGPTDLALLASALERAAREVSAAEVPSLLAT
ncbi:FHA domain-containing protein [Streptomyces roseirectus]|uniref:FHA domain-containing protein n=1 Tax=Streptomyces roseirectus TaxID=2768066 RepID=A0A7H0IHX1_9ACTN|nr:FHA domain-containing protein [Streptomyces roseirectus]QNP72387.1 FHA domain-containing protein [Streptomyces roseirectus]